MNEKKIIRTKPSEVGWRGYAPDRAFLPALLVAAAAGAALLQSRYYVGFFNDDASFVLLAQGLLDHLWSLSGAGFKEAFSLFLPGYPLFLAPFVAALGPHWDWLRWTTAGVSIFTVYGLWSLLGGWLSEEERRWAVLLYALHPVFLLCSGMVMADPFLSCLFVFGLLALRRVLEGGGAGAHCLLISISVWAAATKPTGIILAVAVTGGLAAAKARRGLLLMGLFFWLPCLVAGALALMKNQSPTDYITYFSHGLASLSGQPLLERAYGLLHTFVLVYGLGWLWPRGPLFDMAGAVLASGALYFILKGFAALLSGQGPGRFTAAAAGLLLLGQALVMSLWTVYSERYALPMLPFGLPLLAAGLFSQWRERHWAPRLALAALAAGFIFHSGKLAAETRFGASAEGVLCERTLEWIRRETPPESRFIGSAPLICLYTGRKGGNLTTASNFDAFLSGLARSGITHAMVTGQVILSSKGAYSSNQALRKEMERAWIRHHPRIFKKIYSDPEEGTEVYLTQLPPLRREAERHYAAALRAIAASDLAAAAASLKLSLAEDPDFSSALVVLATIRMQQRREPAEAEKMLRRALALDPNFERAARKLVELLEGQGRGREADEVRASGTTAVLNPPFEVTAR